MPNDQRRSEGLAAFSVDVEDYFHAEALRDFCPRSRWEEFDQRVEPNTERVLAILEQFSARGTFFVLGWVAHRFPSLVKRIATAGHEIASHGYDHELIYRQTRDEFRQDVRRSRLMLEDIAGQQVVGYRAPSYTIMKKTWWAPPILAQEGYRYDSSIYPIARRRYGIPTANRWPHQIPVDSPLGPLQLVEFPLPTVRFWMLNCPATGGAYLRLLPLSFQRWSVRRMLRNNQPFVLSIHPWELDPGQPRFRVGARTRWTHYTNLEGNGERLRSILSLSSYRSVSEVLTDLRLL